MPRYSMLARVTVTADDEAGAEEAWAGLMSGISSLDDDGANVEVEALEEANWELASDEEE